jgi:hypothetical protein
LIYFVGPHALVNSRSTPSRLGKCPGSTDAPGLWSRSGVAHQYAKEIAGGNETVNSFFTGVITAVVQQYLDASGIGGDAGQAIIDTFFESGAAGLRHSF